MVILYNHLLNILWIYLVIFLLSTPKSDKPSQQYLGINMHADIITLNIKKKIKEWFFLVPPFFRWKLKTNKVKKFIKEYFGHFGRSQNYQCYELFSTLYLPINHKSVSGDRTWKSRRSLESSSPKVLNNN